MERVDYADQNSVGRQSTLEKFRVQVPVVLATTLALQFAFAELWYGLPFTPQNAINSMVLALCANFAGLLSYRGMRLYPGARRFAFLVSSFALSWSLAMALLVVLRVPYSSSQLAIGFIGGFSLMALLNLWNRRSDRVHFLMIPSPKVDRIIAELPSLQYTICRSPKEICRGGSVIVADLHADMPAAWEHALAQAALQGSPIFHVKQMSEALTGRVQIEHLSENPLGRLAPDPSYVFLKQVCERIFAAISLIILSPLLLFAALAIRIDSPGPSLFLQTRIGYRGQEFTIIKFRTMVNCPEAARRGGDVTVANDPRITRLGRFLRVTRIDELPQLINVVRGEMSLIGPRPETVGLSRLYSESLDFYAYRHVVLPGITGWAQINQGHVASTEDVQRKLQYDFYYIKHFSLWLDIVIIIRTVQVMILRMGAH
jgi:lipopolysaccharide/colanic/teichoic acid biosynthesis glycosyltransferase